MEELQHLGERVGLIEWSAVVLFLIAIPCALKPLVRLEPSDVHTTVARTAEFLDL